MRFNTEGRPTIFPTKAFRYKKDGSIADSDFQGISQTRSAFSLFLASAEMSDDITSHLGTVVCFIAARPPVDGV